MARQSYACASTGGACEWALEADSSEVILQRVADHQKCAHHVAELSPDFRQRVAAAIRMA